jgi:hypothetical protein
MSRSEPIPRHATGVAGEICGAAVADTFKGRAQDAQPALVNGTVVVAWVDSCAWYFRPTVVENKIVAIEVGADPEHLGQFDLAILATDEPTLPERERWSVFSQRCLSRKSYQAHARQRPTSSASGAAIPGARQVPPPALH